MPLSLSQKELKAQNLFESCCLNGISIIESNGWDVSDPNDLTKIVYYEAKEGAAPESEKGNFHVRFGQDGTVVESYLLDMKSGNELYVGDH